MSVLFDMRVDAPELAEVALGLASVLARFDGLLDQHAPVRAASCEAAATADVQAADDGTLVLLGLVALRERLGRMLTDASTAHARGEADAQRATTATMPQGRGSLLR